MSKNFNFYFYGLLFLIAIYFPIFLHLDVPTLFLWDEATNALQAYEMSQNGNYLRRFFLGHPDTWETKPPLLTWLQVICMKSVGYNELAVRLPSALAGLGTIFFIVSFFKKELNSIAGGVFSSLILLTSAGYIRGHVLRSGDHDALLIMFLVAAALYFYKYIVHPKNQNKHLIGFTLFFILGVLTKSIAGLYFAPALLIFVLIKRKFFTLLSSLKFWSSVLAFFVVIGSYYLSNEYYYPGYLELVWNNELFPRFFNTAETYNYTPLPSPFHYLQIIINDEFRWYWALIPASITLVFFAGKEAEKEFLKFLILNAVVFLFIISKGTFNSWYHSPAFPLLAMIVGLGLGLFYRLIKEKIQDQSALLRHSLPLLFSFTFFFTPYKTIIQEKAYKPKTHKHDPKYGNVLKHLHKHHPDIKDFFVYYQPRNRHFLFYESVFNDQFNYNIKSCGPGNFKHCPEEKQAQIGDLVLVCQNNLQQQVNKHHEVTAILQHEGCLLYKIDGNKEVKEN